MWFSLPETVAMPEHLPLESADPVSTRVLRAAREELFVRGLDRVSIDAIAARARTSKTTIYDRFATKSDLFASVLQFTIAEAGGETLPDVRDLPTEEALTHIGYWLDRSARVPANLALYRANIVAAARFPELSAKLHGLRANTPALIAFVDDLPARSCVPDLSANQLAQWFGVLATGGLHYLLGLPSDIALDRARIKSAADLFAGGWRSAANEHAARPCLKRPAPYSVIGDPARTPESRWFALLDETARSLLESGVRGTGIDGLSSKTGLSKTTIYRRFGNKDQLIAAALDHFASRLVKDPIDIPTEKPLDAALTSFGLKYYQRFSHPDHVALLRLMVGEAAHRPELIGRLWQRIHAPAHLELSDFLQDRAATDELHLTDPTMAAEQFSLMAAGGNRLLTGSTKMAGHEAEEYMRNLTRFCLR